MKGVADVMKARLEMTPRKLSEEVLDKIMRISSGYTYRYEEDYSTHHYIVSFPNGYKASIISGPGNYCIDDRPFEVAVLDRDGKICYSTPISDNVIGYCKESDVFGICRKIKRLEVISE